MALANSATSAVLLLALTLALAGCATSCALRAGTSAEQAQDYDRAVIEYTKALQAEPGQPRCAARPRARQDCARRSTISPAAGASRDGPARRSARRAAAGRASSIPRDSDVEDLLNDVRTQLRTKVAVAREGKTELETLIERARDLPAARPRSARGRAAARAR